MDYAVLTKQLVTKSDDLVRAASSTLIDFETYNDEVVTALGSFPNHHQRILLHHLLEQASMGHRAVAEVEFFGEVTVDTYKNLSDTIDDMLVAINYICSGKRSYAHVSDIAAYCRIRDILSHRHA